jgi:uncharacterized protein (DUF305 family)
VTFSLVPVVRPALLCSVLAGLPLVGLLAGSARAQMEADPHHHHHHHPAVAAPAAAPGPAAMAMDHSAHALGPAGSTYDLRWIDAMVLHHSGALRMSEFMFDIGQPGVGALARRIWSDQAGEIKAMGQWRRAWYPDAPPYPVVLAPGGSPDSMDGLARMGPAQIEAMRMGGGAPTRETRVTWFLEGMIAHHGGALAMAHDALAKSRNPTIRRLARRIIVAQRREILELRRMLRQAGLTKPDYHRYDPLFAF